MFSPLVSYLRSLIKNIALWRNHRKQGLLTSGAHSQAPHPLHTPKLETSVRRPCFPSLLNLALWSQGMTSADPLPSFEILLKSRPSLRHELRPSYLNSACYFGMRKQGKVMSIVCYFEMAQKRNLSCQTQLKSMKGSLFSKEVVEMEEEGKLLTMSLPYTHSAFLS